MRSLRATKGSGWHVVWEGVGRQWFERVDEVAWRCVLRTFLRLVGFPRALLGWDASLSGVFTCCQVARAYYLRAHPKKTLPFVGRGEAGSKWIGHGGGDARVRGGASSNRE